MRNIKEQRPEKDFASATLFRTTNFFVHAFTPVVKTSALQKAGGNATILERVRWVSAEKQRLMAAQTRLLPQAETVDASLFHEITIPVGLEALAIAFVLALTLLIQAVNLFNFPAYGAEEGKIMANAWALLHGQITPSVYTYDQPPIGWVQIAAWLQLTGGLASFGNAINSGRVLMLVLALASSLMLYLITSRLTASRSAAVLATVLYSFSSLSLIYRHEILLDNIAMFWLLLSLCLITTGKSRLGTFVLAAIAMGIAVLSSEVFLFFVPAVLYAIWLYATPFQRKFSLLTSLYVVLAVTSAYVLLALLKGELFPVGTQVSLIGSLLHAWQAPVADGQFAESWNLWMQAGRLFLLTGAIAIFVNVLGGTVNRFQLLAALLAATACAIVLLSREVPAFSIVVLLPFLALNSAMALNAPLRWVTRKTGFDLVRALLFFMLIGALLPASIQQARPLLAQNTAAPQRQAMLWIGDNAAHSAVVIATSYMYSDLREPGGMSVGTRAPFTHAYIYSDVTPDSPTYNEQLKGDWQNIDFLIVDASMLNDITDGAQYRLLNQALHHGLLRVSFGSADDGTQMQIYQINRSKAA